MIKKDKKTSDRSPQTAAESGLAPAESTAPRDEAFLTTRELMEFLNLSRTKVWELVTKQGLPAFKIGGDYRYRRSEVLAWLERYRVKPGGDKND